MGGWPSRGQLSVKVRTSLMADRLTGRNMVLSWVDSLLVRWAALSASALEARIMRCLGCARAMLRRRRIRNWRYLR